MARLSAGTSPNVPSLVEAAAALDVLAEDGLVAFPTETVWGLAARAESPEAVGRLRAFKGRDAGKPVSVMVDGPDRLAELGIELGPQASALVRAFWPGPLTIIAKCRRSLAPGVAASDGSVGLRCSPHPIAAALAGGALERGLGPVTATSLNRSGHEPARHTDEVVLVAEATPDIPVVVVSGEAGGGEPSTVIDVTGDAVRILREGAIASSRGLAVVQAEAERIVESRDR
jgi:L-threonylcarbamoyladenylate synthase